MLTTKKRTLQVVLNEEDILLFRQAETEYDLGQSKLGEEIIHAWLFANKLQLKKPSKESVVGEKNGNI